MRSPPSSPPSRTQLSSPATLLPTSFPLARPSRPLGIPRRLFQLSATEQPSLLQVHLHHPLDATTIVFWFPHVIQPRPASPLLRPLHHLYRPHSGRVNLHPHLHPGHQEPIPQQHRRVGPPPSYAQTHARERVARLEGRQQDVARLGGVLVVAREESRPRAGRVEDREVRLGGFDEGVGEGPSCGGGRGVGFHRDVGLGCRRGKIELRQSWRRGLGGSCGVVVKGREMASGRNRFMKTRFSKETFPAG